MREQHQVGLCGLDHLAEREREAVGRVFFEEVVFDGEYFVELVGGEVVGKRGDAFANDHAG